MALDCSELSRREPAVRFTNEKRHFVSGPTVCRLLKAGRRAGDHALLNEGHAIGLRISQRYTSGWQTGILGAWSKLSTRPRRRAPPRLLTSVIVIALSEVSDPMADTQRPRGFYLHTGHSKSFAELASGCR